MGLPLKYLSLITLVVQNSALALVLRYSRLIPGTPYLTSTAVVMCEVIKLLCCLVIYFKYEHGTYKPTGERKELMKEVFSPDSWKMSIPAMLYFVQNNLQYVAVTYLDAATFQVTYQMKILTTALFSVLLLGKSLTRLKWISLVLLTAGIALVQIPTSSPTSSVSTQSSALKSIKTSPSLSNRANVVGSRRKLLPRGFSMDQVERANGDVWEGAEVAHAVQVQSDDMNAQGNEDFEAELNNRYDQAASSSSSSSANNNNKEKSNSFVGLVAVTIACVISGLAGVYFEKVLKGSSTSLWVRNIQLCVFSIIPGYLVGVLMYDGERLAQGGFFQGYNFWTWMAILCQAVGGLIVAVVVKYADNILKGFATSISIILSSVASVFLFDFVITMNFVAGTALVIYATSLYGRPDKVDPKKNENKYGYSKMEEGGK